jgi:hypothetical protein
MIDSIVELFAQNRFRLVEAPVFESGAFNYWHSTVVNELGIPISGGFGEVKSLARKVAVSELIERQTYRELMNGTSEEKRSWKLDGFPTGCGFAAGFEREATARRSISEGIERWVMSQWIDEGFHIPESEVNISELDKVSRFLIEQFDQVKFYFIAAKAEVEGKVHTINVAQTMGLKNGGIFPGSSAQVTGGSIWQHALLESFRHLIGVKNNPDRPGVFPDNKVHFFAKNAEIAIQQIAKADRHDWPKATLSLHKTKDLYDGRFFVCRTIFSGWTSWHEGPIERFLY